MSEQSEVSGPCSKTINQSKQSRVESHWKFSNLLKENYTRETYITILEKAARRVKSDNDIYTVLIERNSQVFDNPTLLRQGGHQLCEKLSCLDVFFSDSFLVYEELGQT